MRRRKIRKFADREQSSRQTENSSKTEATLILCGSSGERANNSEEEREESSIREKSCVKCNKKFIDGARRKSTVIICSSCSELTHLKCAGKSPSNPFYCSKCPVISTVESNSVEESSQTIIEAITSAPFELAVSFPPTDAANIGAEIVDIDGLMIFSLPLMDSTRNRENIEDVTVGND